MVRSGRVQSGQQVSESKTPGATYAAYASSFTILGGRPARFLDLHRHAYELALHSDDVSAQALALRHQGLGLWGSVRYADSLECLRKAAELLRTRVADTWQLVYTHFWTSSVHYRAGNLSDAVREARQAFESRSSTTSTGSPNQRLSPGQER